MKNEETRKPCLNLWSEKIDTNGLFEEGELTGFDYGFLVNFSHADYDEEIVSSHQLPDFAGFSINLALDLGAVIVGEKEIHKIIAFTDYAKAKEYFNAVYDILILKYPDLKVSNEVE